MCGGIGRGKTVIVRRLQQHLKEENRVLVAKSLAVEKYSIKLGILMTALFYDLSTEEPLRIPIEGEKREWDLRELVTKNKCPVALFIDEAHDLNDYTLTGLKRLMEVVEDGDGRLSIALAGSQRQYLNWLLDACTERTVAAQAILTADAIDLPATKLRTPLQIQLHLTLALDVGDQAGEQPISADLVESVLSKQLKDLVEQFDARPAELKTLFNNQLDPTRTAE